jgi:hypothetical protein
MPRSPHPPPDRLTVDLNDLPPEGREMVGEIAGEVFAMEPGGPRPASPLRYRLWIQRRKQWLVATGELSADFTFECVLCLKSFTDRVSLESYVLEEELAEKSPVVDLTDRLREDILLALPGHPRCSESSLHPTTCPAAELFLPASSYSPDHPEEAQSDGRRHLWSALDQLEIKSAKGRKKSSKPPT